MELERILLPASAHFENEFEPALPPAQCEPLVFHQNVPTGISVHVFFKAPEPTEAEEDNTGSTRSSVARFPAGRVWQKKGPV